MMNYLRNNKKKRNKKNNNKRNKNNNNNKNRSYNFINKLEVKIIFKDIFSKLIHIFLVILVHIKIIINL